MAITYQQAGVNVQANTQWVSAIRAAMAATYGPRVIDRRHGGFAGLFRLQSDDGLFRQAWRNPVLVGCTDGVGTKVLLAVQLNRLSTIGIDLVAMNVNDLITTGAEPLFFLDYLATHQLEPDRLLAVIQGVSAGCIEARCALLGGETAEMPDLYKKGHVDLAGFAVGVVEHSRIVDGSRIAAGDVLIGLPSAGVHSNGYSLVRKLIDTHRLPLDDKVESLGESLADALLRPTRIYVNAVLAVLRAYRSKQPITGMAHITGGGLRENVGRILPRTCDAVMRTSCWRPQPIFDLLRNLGVSRAEMYKVFNMGLGYVFSVKKSYVAGVMKALESVGEGPLLVGEICKGAGRVRMS